LEAHDDWFFQSPNLHHVKRHYPGDIHRGEIYDCQGRITEEGLRHSNCKILPPDCVLIALAGQGKTRASVAILRVPSACNQSLVAIIPFSQDILSTEYLYLSLKYRYHEVRDITGQRQRRGLNMGLVSQLSIPLAPIEEQRRIVAKVDALMALCDKLEAQQQRRDMQRDLARDAALDHLVAARTSEALSSAWGRARKNIDLWLEDKHALPQLGSAISFLGCRGLLTETVRIDFGESKDDAYSLPTGWCWTTLGHLAEYVTSGSRGWKQFLAPQGDTVIRSQDIKHDSLVFEDRALVDLPSEIEGKRALVRPDDLLVTITGANVGKCARVPRLPGKAYVSQHVALVRLKDVRHAPFLHLWITNAYGGRGYLAHFIHGDKPGLNLHQVKSIPVPLPPQEVQNRVVEAASHYAALCDKLAVQLENVQSIAGSFATAAIASITGIEVEEGSKMKAPKTVLVSTLQLGVTPANGDQAPLAAILIRNNGQLAARTLWNSSGLDIAAFYQQLKTEMAKGWITQPEVAYMKAVEGS
jgi:type I restriction enzyme S subunit